MLIFDQREEWQPETTLASDDPVFTAKASIEDGRRRVRLRGEMDSATRNVFFGACLGGERVAAVDVEMTELTFMDCAGYGAVVAVGQVLGERGGGVTLLHPAGQPARLLVALRSQWIENVGVKVS